MKKNINEIYDRFFMMDVILDDDGQSVSSLYFHIDDVVGWKTTVSIDPKSFYIDLMFKGGHTVCTIHARAFYDDIIIELEEAKIPWMDKARQMRDANNGAP